MRQSSRAVLRPLVGLWLGGLLAGAPQHAAGQDEACCAETESCVWGPVLSYWLAQGSLAINGYPLSNEFIQV